jgi:hypothetical protein
MNNPPIWKRPTRRTFMALLSAAAAALAIKTDRQPDKPVLPKWIGHA